MIELKGNVRCETMDMLCEVFDCEAPYAIAIKYDSKIIIMTNDEKGYSWNKVKNTICDAYLDEKSIFMFKNHGEFNTWIQDYI